MKKIILISVLLISFAAMKAQSKEVYQKEMTNIVQKIDSAKTSEELTDLNNRLTRVSNLYKNEWLPVYYAAYVNLFQSFYDPKKSEQYLEEAENQIEKTSDFSNSDISEILALKAFINVIKMSKNPMVLAPQLMPEISKDLKQAIAINPKNPRPRMVLAELNINKKAYFKEDISAECNQISEIETLLNNQNSGTYLPKWGKGSLERIKNSCQKK